MKLTFLNMSKNWACNCKIGSKLTFWDVEVGIISYSKYFSKKSPSFERYCFD